jgi:AraC-like DNA-binding protein
MPVQVKIRKTDLDKFELVKQLIQEDIKVHYTISQLSAASTLNEFKLKMGFRQLYKTSIYEFLQNERMKRGLHLLSTSEDSIQEIAKNCGYDYATNFIAVFRKKFKVKPTDYRKSQVIGRALTPSTKQYCFTPISINPLSLFRTSYD